ncbi:DNA-processing protein DprA [Pseudobacteroides cellulosolvens]|uniref:SMF family protein n=1 Tax=Pseudobacteroides cellulosolvens ATCC 35603 = DSM 2933 TaxID=398512 RepID=A0A0L6JQA2_9FIRM|nr:DNA-processing protein DprA [Pseudobacteroides cellulosolvens]KNY27968.1 SMF family protein [Pseudobacteroides cellulosolvens ATCC 35603 = DSM 2933]
MIEIENSEILAMLCTEGVGRKRVLEAIRGKSSVETPIYARDRAKYIMDRCNYLGISIIGYSELPLSLRLIDESPVLLFVKGIKDLLYSDSCEAVVGTRNPSIEGEEKAKEVTEILVDRGKVIVSGLALGVDTIAHKTCLGRNGHTIAILPSPIDRIYPGINTGLAESITYGGCLVSEYMPGVHVQKYFFIQRDRLQAALSSSVYVIETGMKDGTMHTANYAIKYAKELYCCIYSSQNQSNEGNYELLKGKARVFP